MADIHTVFEAVLDNGISGKQVEVICGTVNDYETIRTRLVTLWNVHKNTLVSIAGPECDPLIPYSLCGNFDGDSCKAVFYLGKSRRRLAKSYSFAIVGIEAQDVSLSTPSEIPIGTTVVATTTVLTSEPANDPTLSTPTVS